MTAGGSHPVPNSSVGPGGEESHDYQSIMKMMHGLDPGQVGNAADVFTSLADQLDSLRGAMKSAAAQASQNWSGSAAQAAMDQFQVVHDQTAQLAAQSRTAGNTLSWLSNDVMPKYQSIPSPQVAGGWKGLVADAAQGVASGKGGIEEAMGGGPGKAKANSAAQDYLKTFNQHLATANNAMPKSLASPGTPGRQATSWGTSPSSQAGSASAANGSSSGPGNTGVPASSTSGGGSGSGHTPSSSANPFAASKLPHSGAGPSASLQGSTAPSVGATPPPYAAAGGSGGGGSANPFARMPMMPNAGSRFGGSSAEGEGGPGENAAKLGKSSVPGEEDALPGKSGVSGSAEDGASAAEGASGAGDAAGAEAAGSEAAGAAGSGEGAAGMPMGAGGGGGSQDKERQRQAWMHEDTSIWGLPDKDIGSILE